MVDTQILSSNAELSIYIYCNFLNNNMGTACINTHLQIKICQGFTASFDKYLRNLSRIPNTAQILYIFNQVSDSGMVLKSGMVAGSS